METHKQLGRSVSIGIVGARVVVGVIEDSAAEDRGHRDDGDAQRTAKVFGHRRNSSHCAKARQARKPGYTTIGSATSIWSRSNSNRASTVSSSAVVRHASHAGKYEPRMSNDGARSQPADARHVNRSPYRR